MTDSEDDPAASGETLAAMAGAGTEAAPYVVTTAAELQAMADDLTAHYELGEDIDASETAAWNDGRGFDPVGGTDNPFTGSVDGNGHRITGLTVDRSDQHYVGLFGHSEGSVSNLELEISLRGESSAGGVVGKNHEGGAITAVSATVDIAMDDSFVGGAVGYNEGHVADAETRGTVSADNKTGGLVGTNDGGSVVTSRATATVDGADGVGGLIGSSSGDAVTDCHASGDISGEASVGGLIGYNKSDVRESTASGAVSGVESVGGLVGSQHGSAELSSLTASGTVTADGNFAGGLVGLLKFGAIKEGIASGSVSGAESVGGLVGIAFHDTGLTDATASGTVEGEQFVGGLVGESNCDLRICTASGDVSGEESVGGLVGLARFYTHIEGCTASGDVTGPAFDVGGSVQDHPGDPGVGRLVGHLRGTVEEAVASGTVTAEEFDVGGDVGCNEREYDTPEELVDVAVDLLLESGMATRANIEGVSPEDIADAEAEFGVEFPAIYRAFLRRMGREHGTFLRGTDSEWHRIPGRITSVDEEFSFHDDHFVFMGHQGDSYLFFDTSEDEPAVYNYVEHDGEPERRSDTFGEWLVGSIDGEIQLERTLD